MILLIRGGGNMSNVVQVTLTGVSQIRTRKTVTRTLIVTFDEDGTKTGEIDLNSSTVELLPDMPSSQSVRAKPGR